jgi:hypothetical protein
MAKDPEETAKSEHAEQQQQQQQQPGSTTEADEKESRNEDVGSGGEA